MFKIVVRTTYRCSFLEAILTGVLTLNTIPRQIKMQYNFHARKLSGDVFGDTQSLQVAGTPRSENEELRNCF